MPTQTTTALLQDLVDPSNEAVWAAFDGRYRPILVGFGRKLGLGNEDAADAAQETLARFVRAYRAGKYDRSRGRLRSWLLGIARNAILDVRSAKAGRREQQAETFLGELPDDRTFDSTFEEACEQELVFLALANLRRESRADRRTIEAFELLALGGIAPADVAARLGMTMNDVYLAKHRCLKRLRTIIEELRAAYEIE
jgi:RNA polymerase sigma-70 factor (ECF subfamily)